jgi:hypothetical protein
MPVPSYVLDFLHHMSFSALCPMIWGEKWLFVLLFLVELLTSTGYKLSDLHWLRVLSVFLHVVHQMTGIWLECRNRNIYIYICCQIIILKYICTLYTRLYTCLTSIPRFSLRDKVTLRLLKLLFKGVDVVEWSRALDVRLSELCCSVSMVWVQIPSREEQTFDSSKI